VPVPSLQMLDQAAEPAERLSQRAYQAIRVSLQNGELQPGQRLILRPLASKLGLSATPVREALLRLVSEQALGLDERNSVLVPMLGGEDLDELEELRTDLEGRAAAVAARSATAAEIAELTALQDELEDARGGGDTEGAVAANARFHRLLLQLSRRPTLLRVVDGVQARLGPILAMTRDAALQRFDEHPHRALLQALERRDAEGAREAMMADIGLCFARVRRALAARVAVPLALDAG
jgi:DNA-binding GntR family transcriptional regulator